MREWPEAEVEEEDGYGDGGEVRFPGGAPGEVRGEHPSARHYRQRLPAQQPGWPQPEIVRGPAALCYRAGQRGPCRRLPAGPARCLRALRCPRRPCPRRVRRPAAVARRGRVSGCRAGSQG